MTTEKNVDKKDSRIAYSPFEHLLIKLFDVVFAAISAIFGSLWRGVCFLTHQHFTFDGLSEKERHIRIRSVLIVLTLLAILGYSLWVYLFQKQTHLEATVNLKTEHPSPSLLDSTLFITEDVPRLFQHERSVYVYRTYSKLMEEGNETSSAAKMCQMVPKDHSLSIFMTKHPVYASGFTATFEYYAVSKESKDVKKFSGKWETFDKSFNKAVIFGERSKLFILKTNEDQYGIVCF